MGLFNQILGAIQSSGQQGGLGQLGGMVDSIQQLSRASGANPDQLQSLLSVVASFSRSALQEKQNTQGEEQAQALVNQYSGLSANPQAVQALFTLPQLQQLIQVGAEKTGLPATTIESVLPTAVPLVLQILQMGANQAGKNPLLKSFLDADGDGDVDMADLMQLVNRYL